MSIVVYTSRINYAGNSRLDITVKSGTGLGSVLAPTWDMVMGLKRGTLTETQYTGQYLALTRERFANNRAPFYQILAMPEVVLCCFCQSGAFCHRHLAVDILEKIAMRREIEFVRGGEIVHWRA